MKKKVLSLMLGGLLLTGGVVGASGIWGDYYGNSIVRLTVEGKEIQVSDVPVINYAYRTMIPIYLLKQAGINYSWDQSTQTVDIKRQASQTQYVNLAETERQSGRALYLANNYNLFAFFVKDSLRTLTIYAYQITGNQFGKTTQSDIRSTYDSLQKNLDFYEDEFDKFSPNISSAQRSEIQSIKRDSESLLQSYKKAMDLLLEADDFKSRDYSRSKTAYDKSIEEWDNTSKALTDLANKTSGVYLDGVNDVIR